MSVYDLAGRKALVTGGARGLGEGMARALARAGASVVIGDIREDLGKATADSLRGDGARAEFVPLDITAEDSWVQAIPQGALITLDAAALGLLAVAGAEKSLDQGLSWLAAILVGGVTGVGGGVIRDILLDKIPAVLTRDIYATAALAGAAVMLIGRRLGLPNVWAAILGAVFCFALRMVAVGFGWQLPKAG